MSKRPPAVLPRDRQVRWLAEHIPHRIRATLPGLPMPPPWNLGEIHVVPQETTALRCLLNSSWEGRMTALRWLIMFVGIQQDKAGCAVEAKIKVPFDMRIDALDGGILVTPSNSDADKLAKVWRGCSQATSHATDGSGHPPVDEQHLAEALGIVIRHLESTVYRVARRSLLMETLGR
jgi:hypothetical protein